VNGSPGIPTTTEIRPALLAGPTDRQLRRVTAVVIGSRDIAFRSAGAELATVAEVGGGLTPRVA
jgi:hypothetical protein